MKLENQINKVIADELDQSDKSPFSTSGFDMYLKNITAYTVQLFRLSDYLAKKQGIETITESIVARASEKIHKSNDGKILNLVLSFAGLLLGSAVSHLVTLSMDESAITINSMFFVMGTGLTGAFLFGYYLFK